MSNREAILAWLVGRLSGILTADGYATNAGQAVHFGDILELGKDEPDVVIAIVIDDDEVGYQGESTQINLPIEFQAVAKVDIDLAALKAEAVLGDVKRAIEIAGRRVAELGHLRIERGTTRVVPREPGSELVAVGVTYVFPYTEPWGNP